MTGWCNKHRLKNLGIPPKSTIKMMLEWESIGVFMEVEWDFMGFSLQMNMNPTRFGRIFHGAFVSRKVAPEGLP